MEIFPLNRVGMERSKRKIFEPDPFLRVEACDSRGSVALDGGIRAENRAESGQDQEDE